MSLPPAIRRRPWGITILGWIVLLLIAFNLARVIQTVQAWDALAILGLVSPFYPLLSGAVWCLLGVALWLGLYARKPWAERLLLPTGLLYSAYLWLDRLAVPGYAERNANWPFVLLANILTLVLLFVLHRQAAVRQYFGDAHEPSPAGPEQPAPSA